MPARHRSQPSKTHTFNDQSTTRQSLHATESGTTTAAPPAPSLATPHSQTLFGAPSASFLHGAPPPRHSSFRLRSFLPTATFVVLPPGPPFTRVPALLRLRRAVNYPRRSIPRVIKKPCRPLFELAAPPSFRNQPIKTPGRHEAYFFLSLQPQPAVRPQTVNGCAIAWSYATQASYSRCRSAISPTTSRTVDPPCLTCLARSSFLIANSSDTSLIVRILTFEEENLGSARPQHSAMPPGHPTAKPESVH